MAADDSTREWYDRAVERVPEAAWRRAGALWFVLAIAYRVRQNGWSTEPIVWLETAIPAAILYAYLTRTPPARPARGFAAVVLPFAAAGLPFLLLRPRFTDWGAAHLQLFGLLLAVPTLWMLASYAVLRRSYALMAEARGLVTRGPYALMRHPVYVAQALCGAVVLAFRFSWISVAVYVAFLLAQHARLGAEERALAEAHGKAWEDYAARVGRFGPRLTSSPRSG